jgi:hypothetical protein
MEKITKAEVKKAFKSARELMRELENELTKMDKYDSIYLDDDSNIGQMAMGLIAEVTIFDQYRYYLVQENRG